MSRIKYSVLYPILPSSSLFLNHTLPIVLDNSREDFEVIVSINGPSDPLFELPISDPRLVLVTPNKLLSMNQHYEFVLRLAKGSWIQLLGADDFVTSEYFSQLDEIVDSNENLDVINWSRNYYFWNFPNSISPTQVDFKISFRKKRLYRARIFLTMLGMLSMFELPQLYTCSAIKRNFILKISENSENCFYHSMIPDIYSSIAIADYKPRIITLSRPLTWVGTSSASSGGGRIYSDFTKASICDRHRHNELHTNIYKKSHELSYESLFLLECLYQYLDTVKEKRQLWLVLLYANFLSDIVLRNQYSINRLQVHRLFSHHRIHFIMSLIFLPITIVVKRIMGAISAVRYYAEIKFGRRFWMGNDRIITPAMANSMFNAWDA